MIITGPFSKKGHKCCICPILAELVPTAPVFAPSPKPCSPLCPHCNNVCVWSFLWWSCSGRPGLVCLTLLTFAIPATEKWSKPWAEVPLSPWEKESETTIILVWSMFALHLEILKRWSSIISSRDERWWLWEGKTCPGWAISLNVCPWWKDLKDHPSHSWGSSFCSHRNLTSLCLTFWEAQPVPWGNMCQEYIFENLFPAVQGKQNPWVLSNMALSVWKTRFIFLVKFTKFNKKTIGGRNKVELKQLGA